MHPSLDLSQEKIQHTMGSVGRDKAHAVLIPYPAQGHITPMLKLAKLLHSEGFFVTFVLTEYNYSRLLRSGGPTVFEKVGSSSSSSFRFETIPDGLPETDAADGGTQDIPSLCVASAERMLGPFRELLGRLVGPPLTCIVSDGAMSFTLDAAEEVGVPDVLFWTTSACGLMAYLHYRNLVSQGFIPLKSADDLTNGYLDVPIDFVPGMSGMRLKDFPSFVRTTEADDLMLNFLLRESGRAARASAIVLNTFDDLERPVLDAMSSILAPPIYTLGPLHFLTRQLSPDSPIASLSSSLWKEDMTCLDWLDTKESGSVVYVNFGSITVMSNQQLIEFAWGLARSGRDFLWVIRPDLVRGDDAVLPAEFVAETAGRGMLASWCQQEAVLSHRAVGGFLTHNGWNSTLESIAAGVPMICWPFFAEQQTNCRYACAEWGIGMEIDNNVQREEVEGLIRELMGGDKGRAMRKAVAELKEKAAKAAGPGGSSFRNLNNVIQEVLLPKSAF